jgi:hypothetical protein
VQTPRFPLTSTTHSVVYPVGEEQTRGGVTLSEPLNVKVGVLSAVGPEGPLSITVSGATVSGRSTR